MKSIQYTKYIFGVMVFLYAITCYSQPVNNRFNDAVMPAPNAASLGKYSDIPVSTFTGVPDISIPIYTVQDGPLSMPISMSYHASGLKPGEPASWVGAGWSLNSGGIITRTILNIKDERFSNGFLNNNNSGECVAGTCFDSEPDIFSYNLNGYSGKFVLKPRSTPASGADIVFIEKTDMKGTVSFSVANNFIQQITGFIFIDPQGVRYIFSDNSVEAIGGDTETDKSTWYLSQMQSYDQKFAINFNYTNESYSYMSPASCGQEKANWGCGPGVPASSLISTNFCNGVGEATGQGAANGKKYHRVYVDGKRLTSISNSSLLTTVTFTEGGIRKDMGIDINTSNPNAKFLDKIRVTSGGYCKEWKMAYSYFYDNTNYSTSAVAASGLPSGTTDHEQRYKLKLDKITEQSSVDCSTANPTAAQIINPPHVFEYYGSASSYTDGSNTINTVFFPSTLTHAIDHWGGYNGQTGNNIVDVNAPINTFTSTGGLTVTTPATANREPDPSNSSPVMIDGSLKKITYPTGGNTTFVYEPNMALTNDWAAPAFSTLLSLSTCSNCANNACCGSLTDQQTVSLTEEDISSALCEMLLTSIPMAGCVQCSGMPPPNPNYLLEIFEGSSTTAFASRNFNISSAATTSPTTSINLWEMANFKPNINYTFKLTVIAGKGICILKKPNLLVNRRVGGIRIKSITTNDAISSSNDIIRTYEYSDITNSANSSGRIYNIPRYGFSYFEFKNSDLFTDFVKISANPYTPLSSYKGYIVGYQKVTELYNGNGKKVYYHYTESAEARPPLAISPPEAPSLKGGQVYFSATINSSNTEISRTVITPDSDVKFESINFNKPVQKTYRLKAQSTGCNIDLVVAYNPVTTQYRIKSSTETQDGVVSTTTMDYSDNATLRRTQPRYISTVNSDGKTTKVEQLFAYDYILTGPNSNTKIKLEEFNLIGTPYQVSNYVNNIQISGTQTEYGLVNPTTYVWDNSTTTGTIPYPRYFRNYESIFGTNGQPTGGGNWVTQGEVLDYYTTGLAKKYLTTGWASTDFEEFTWTNGLITQSKFKNFTKTYDYHAGTRMLSAVTAIDGQKVWYDYDPLMRLQKVWARPSTANTKTTAQVANEYQYKYIDGSTPRNYVRTIATYGAVAGSSISTIENSSYMDGLGREVQTVGKKASPSQNDIISVVTYDNQGRVVRKYVPFVVASNTGGFISNPPLSTIKFTENTYEASPLNRGLTTTPPGWYASTMTYGVNTATDNVKKDLSTGTLYSANDLYKTTTTDPNGNKTIAFSDKKGRTILTRRTDNAGTNTADTYNIFDDKDRLITVVPPGALISETNSIFSYTYDPSDNMLTKKVPGKGLEKMAYDARDLLTFYQDNVMSATPRWMMTKYNAYGQATSTGFWNGTTPPANNSATAFNELLTETLYDDATAIFKGRIKQTKVKILDGAATPKWLENNFTYDSHGRTSQINGNSHINLTLGSEVINFNTYDWADNVIQKTRTHKKTTTSTLTLRDRYTYDHRARMNNYYHKIDAGTEVLVSNQVYNDRNFLTQKNLHGTTGGGYLQNVDYYYNDQGWLTGINTMCLSGAAAAASAPPPASASNIQVKLFTVANQLNGSANEEKTYFGTSVSADIKVDGAQKTIDQTDYFVVEKPGTEAAVWQKMDNLPADIVFSTSVSVGMDDMYLDQDSDFSEFYLKVEKMVIGGMLEQGIAMEKAAPVANAVQTALDQVLTPVSAAAAAPAVAAALAAPTSSDLFSMGLLYNTANTTLGAPLQKNGNISHIWSQVACNNPQYYGFQYDFLDRLTTANNTEYNTSTAAYINTNRYNESSTFDLRGNITSVIRRGMTATNTFGVIDNMGYTYVATDKNRVNGILDVASTTKGFKVLNASQQLYTYDNNGNMSRDNHKKMSTTYFYHNMPKTITFDNGNTINWLYDASGNKLTKTTSAATNNVTHYLGGIEYVGTAATFNLEAIYHTEGRCTPQAGNTWRYEYNIRDHLGNTRVTFADLDNSGTVTTTEILQQNHYYPFGANIEGLTTTSPNKYQYNGKEWNADFGLEWNDYGARFYDPWVGRWWGVDPLADEQEQWSTYHYAYANPVEFFDPLGLSPERPNTYERGSSLLEICPTCPDGEEYDKYRDSPHLFTYDKDSGVVYNGDKITTITGTPLFLYGIGRFLIWAGDNTLDTKAKPDGSTPGTSRASVFFRERSWSNKKIPNGLFNILPKKVSFMGLKSPLRTNTWGALVGRLTPMVGYGLVFLAPVISIATVITSDDKSLALSRESGGLAGMYAGAEVGALAGAWFGGVGAVPGAFVGGIVGYIGGSILGETIHEELNK